MSENASSRNSISWNWFCQGLVHTIPQDLCPTGTCPVGNCMNLSLAKPSSMILSSWKRYILRSIMKFFQTALHMKCDLQLSFMTLLQDCIGCCYYCKKKKRKVLIETSISFLHPSFCNRIWRKIARSVSSKDFLKIPGIL